MKFLAVLVISLLGFLVYSNSFSNSFHFDDIHAIVNNAAIESVHGLKEVFNSEPTRIVTSLTFMLNYYLGGNDVRGFHVLSLLIHVASAILVWILILLTFKSPKLKTAPSTNHAAWIALFTAMIFLTHPLQTQPVNYIYQRAVLLAAFFYLAAMILYIKANLSWEESSGLGKGMFFYTGSLLCAILAVLSKENAISLPVMICAYQAFFFSGQKSFRYKRVIPFFLVILIIPLLWKVLNFRTLLSLNKSVVGLAQGIAIKQYAMTQVKVILTYLKLLILPIHQRVEYDYTQVTSFFDPSFLWCALFLVILLVLAWILRKNYQLMSFGIVWFFITLMPESSFWPNNDLIFEHRMYLPLIGFGIFLSSAVFYFLAQKKSLAVRVLVIFVVAYSFLTFERNKIWFNELTLWDDAVRQSPKSSRAYLNRGAAYQAKGDLDHALADYNMVVSLGLIDSITLSNRGLIFEKKGYPDLALANYNLAIQINPHYAGTYCNRAMLYGKQGKLDLALADYNLAIEAISNDPGLYFNRAVINRHKGNYEQASLDFTNALRLLPNDLNLYELRAETYFLMRDFNKAWDDIQQVQRLGVRVNPLFIEEIEKGRSNR